MDRIKGKLEKLLYEYNHAKRQEEEEFKTLKEEHLQVEHILQAQKIVQEAAEAIQTQAHNRISGVVTRCLKAVFGEDAYEFKINFSQKRGRTEADLLFVRDGVEMDPTTASGGGTLDLASFALRLACLQLALPRRRKLLVLDEPFKMVSANHLPAIRELLLSLSNELKIQFLIITHHVGLRVGKVIEL